MKILYAVIGEPFSTGKDHFIVTFLPEFAELTVEGASGLNAQKSVILSEKAL
jgi:hypothetical protein